MRPALLLLVGVLLLPVAAGAQLRPPSNVQVELDADRLEVEADGIVQASGAVRLRAGMLQLAAEEVSYDPDAAVAELDGGVTVVDGNYVARARGGRFDLAAGEGVLEDVILLEKEEALSAEEAFATATGMELARKGRNALEVHAGRVGRSADGSWFAESPEVTTCDCEDGDEPWSVGASSARVTPGESVALKWPVFRVQGVPVAALPWISLPLTTRKTGLLAPVVGGSAQRGVSYEQPLFLVLGRSADLTLTGGYFFGAHRDVESEGRTISLNRGFEGPRVSGELRYVPRVGTSGRAFVAWAYDRSNRIDHPELFDTRGGTRMDDRNRFAVQVSHRDDWGDGLADHLSLNLVSDRRYVRDFSDDVLRRNNEALISTGWVAHRSDVSLLALEGTYLQDLRSRFPRDVAAPERLPLEPVDLFGPSARDTFARLPALDFDLPRLRLPGGAGLSMHAGIARFAPLSDAGFGDWGVDGIGPGDPRYLGPDEGEGDDRFQLGERRAVLRLALRPTLQLPLVLPPFLSLTPYVGWRQQLYLYEQRDEQGHGGYGVAGAAAQTELARDYGTIRHAIVPRAEVRHLFLGVDEDLPRAPYDELDLFPAGDFTQARLSLGTRLSGEEASAELRVGQDFILDPSAAAESFAEAHASWLPFATDLQLRWDGDELRELGVRASLTSSRGDQLRAGYRKLGDDASLRLLAAPDELFASRVRADWLAPIAIEQMNLGFTVLPVRQLELRYDVLVLQTLAEDKLLEQRFGALWTSSCDCWALGISAIYGNDDALRGVSGTLDLGGLLEI